MRPIITLSMSTLLACGPLVPSDEAATTTAPATSETTDAPVPPTSDPITATTIADPTTLDIATSSTSSTSSITSITSSTGSGEDDFVVAPDGGAEGIKCDVFAQDCPPGQKCAAWAEGGTKFWNATKCVDITGDDAPGEPCTAVGFGISGIDSCALGAMCWEVDRANHGTCIALCTGSFRSPMCPSGSSCAVGSEPVLNLCIPGCDPLVQDCHDGDVCIPQEDGFFCVLDASGDDGQVNDPCQLANQCDNGLACLDSAEASAACQQGPTGCCQPFCKFPDAPCPNPDQQCLPWYDPEQPIPTGYEDLGICKLPD